MTVTVHDLVIDQEFKRCLRALTEEEYRGLETDILDDGEFLQKFSWWRDPKDGQPKMVDGHHRFMIWQANRSKLPTPELFELKQDRAPTRFDVIAWIRNHQNHRRNLERHERDMQIHAAYTAAQEDDGGPTLADVSATFDVCERTGRRSLRYGEAVETIREHDPELAAKIDGGGHSQTAVIDAAKNPAKARQKLEKPKTTPPEPTGQPVRSEELTPEDRLKVLQRPFNDVVTILNRANREFASINGEAGVCIDENAKQELKRRISNAKTVVNGRKPHAWCPQCNGNGKKGKCKPCGGRGVLTREIARAVIPDEHVPF